MNILSIKNLCKQYGEKTVLQNVNIDIKKGEIIAIIGHSGSGKSSLLRAINYLDPPTSGEIYIFDKKIEQKDISSIRQKIGLVDNQTELFSNLTVIENMMLGQLCLCGVTKMVAKDNSMLLLKSVGLVEKANFYPHQLTKSQKLRIAIVRCLSMNPNILLLDDPTKDLEHIASNEVMTIIKNLTQTSFPSKDLTILMSTSDRDFIRNAATRVLYLDEMGIYEEGSPVKILEKPKKTLTKGYINNLCSFKYDVISKDFDFVEFFSAIDSYCIRYFIEKKTAIKLRLLAEEMVINIVTPIYKACKLKMSYSEKSDSYLLSISYLGDDTNALEITDDLISVKMVKKCTTKIWHTYKDGENVVNLEF
ncbi:MAG: ATP-binding cassette domain-containing protein [Candidatus Cloacimonetes bacterium]|nr:ATP-binding cassette domain-containing protein [Candidatus Cloacimonadota bacterium]